MGERPPLKFDPKAYGPRIEAILASEQNGARLMPLAPAEAEHGDGLERLRTTPAGELFSDQSGADSRFVECVRGALFLYFSALDESHTISQAIHTPTGSLLHAIMHRQEPDFGNSKYWLRRAGDHPLFPALREAALARLRPKTGASAVAKQLLSQIEDRKQWDAFWFVDQCEEAVRTRDPDLDRELRDLQRLEWRILFDYCCRQAAGDS